MFLVSLVSGLVENFNIGIFSDTINVINVKLCMMVHDDWALWRNYVLIWLSWNFVEFLNASSRSWIYHNFLLLHIFKGDIRWVSWLDKNVMLAFLQTLFNGKIFQTLHNHNFAWGIPICTRFDDLTLCQGHRCVWIINCSCYFFKFLSTVM